MRFALTIAVLALVAAACTPSETSPTTSAGSATSTIVGTATTSGQPDTTSTTQAPTTTSEPSGESAPEPPEVFRYAVVAEKDARRLAVIDPNGACAGDDNGCDLTPIRTVDLSE
ncbi:MAG: hypothetical protein ACC654_05095, partial [Acidimicrobiia bacterium]